MAKVLLSQTIFLQVVPWRSQGALCMCHTLPDTPPPSVSELGLYTVTNDVEKGHSPTQGRLSLILAFEGMALPLGNVSSSKT